MPLFRPMAGSLEADISTPVPEDEPNAGQLLGDVDRQRR
jgi:hypothetical protein